jgi:hypothetical protein
MYIHNYQIHNVLNAYRKQLSQNAYTGDSKGLSQAALSPKDRVSLSDPGQQPAMANMIATEIIDRITQFGPQSEFDGVLANKMAALSADRPMVADHKGVEFTYTLIDAQNHKTTHSLPIQALGALNRQMATQGPTPSDTAKDQQPVSELLDNNQETQNGRKG